MRVAIFGGSFNPPHLAHQMAALYVLETAPVDEVWMVPTFRHPFGKELAPFEDRLAMCQAAAAALGPRVRVSAVERELGAESRTLRTVRRLQADFPEHAFSLVIGADLVAELPSWYGSAELTQAVPFVVVGRAGFQGDAAADRPALPRVSSSEVRAALAAGRSVAGLVPRGVLEYIHRHNLYAAEGPAEPTPSVFIMGAGVVGTALAARLARSGVPVTGLHGRQVGLIDVGGVVRSTGEIPASLSESDAVIIAVRDERISQVAERLALAKAERGRGRLRREQILLHTSGVNPARTILAPAIPFVRAVGTLHPLVSFSDARLVVEGLRDVTFGIEGDAPARAIAQRIVRALGARAVVLEAGDLALYHAGAVVASNYVVALADTARSLLIKAGVPADQALPALIPLLQSVVQNLAQVGLPGALTGPVERGDVSSVERHLGALQARAPDLVELYRLVGRDVLRLAREKSDLDPTQAARLEALFSGSGAGADANGGSPKKG